MKNLESEKLEEQEATSNPKYICLSSNLISEHLRSGHNVMQMPNGDIIVTEVKTVVTQYTWDGIKESFSKSYSEID